MNRVLIQKKKIAMAIFLTMLSVFMISLISIVTFSPFLLQGNTTVVGITILPDTDPPDPPTVVSFDPSTGCQYTLVLQTEYMAEVYIGGTYEGIVSDQTGRWEKSINLVFGENTFQIYVIDWQGNPSSTIFVSATCNDEEAEEPTYGGGEWKGGGGGGGGGDDDEPDEPDEPEEEDEPQEPEEEEPPSDDDVPLETEEEVEFHDSADDAPSFVEEEEDFYEDSDGDGFTDVFENYLETTSQSEEDYVFEKGPDFTGITFSGKEVYSYGVSDASFIKFYLIPEDGDRYFLGMTDVKDNGNYFFEAAFAGYGEYGFYISEVDQYEQVIREYPYAAVKFDPDNELPIDVLGMSGGNSFLPSKDFIYSIKASVIDFADIGRNKVAIYGNTAPLSQVVVLWGVESGALSYSLAHYDDGYFEIPSPTYFDPGVYTAYIYSVDLENRVFSELVEVDYEIFAGGCNLTYCLFICFVFVILLSQLILPKRRWRRFIFFMWFIVYMWLSHILSEDVCLDFSILKDI